MIGEGGFGSVYMAQQSEPVVRRVALKIIKLGMDTRQVIARFEAERQALAMMDHPNIARVLDAGATAAGRPYFVMELVKGVPITEYCDASNLTTRQRLDLFLAVCHAIQHAHQKGIIHRDIKPSNVLVTVADGRPLPKVIDFGIAKATGGRLTDKTLFTEFRQLLGTPEYMSPEQARGEKLDARSDLYALATMLYEALSGELPHDAVGLTQLFAKKLMDVPVPIRKHLPSIDAALEAVIMKGLARERNDRQADARVFRQELRAALADDVRPRPVHGQGLDPPQLVRELFARRVRGGLGERPPQVLAEADARKRRPRLERAVHVLGDVLDLDEHSHAANDVSIHKGMIVAEGGHGCSVTLVVSGGAPWHGIGTRRRQDRCGCQGSRSNCRTCLRARGVSPAASSRDSRKAAASAGNSWARRRPSKSTKIMEINAMGKRNAPSRCAPVPY